MTTLCGERVDCARNLDAIEARNALAAEGFGKLPDEIELWQFREVLVKLGTELGLSSGAVLYALDLMGLLTEADWRGDGRAVTFHSIRAYARKVGKSERTICQYERQLVAAGLAHRTVKHARRHGGQGCEARRTGLDWRAFGAAMPVLLARLDKRRETEKRRLDIEARIRAGRRIVLGLMEELEEGRAADARDAYAAIGVARLRGTLSLSDLESRYARLIALQDALRPSVDNDLSSQQGTDRSEETSRRIDNTNHSLSPEEIRSKPRKDVWKGGESGPTTEPAERVSETERQRKRGAEAIPLPKIWEAAPKRWKSALGCDVDVSWPILIEIADHLAPELGVSPFAWNQALRVLGPSDAAVALLVLDRNRAHPKVPVVSIGGALVGMTRRAARGELNLASSIYGVMARQGRSGERHHA